MCIKLVLNGTCDSVSPAVVKIPYVSVKHNIDRDNTIAKADISFSTSMINLIKPRVFLNNRNYTISLNHNKKFIRANK